jgi:hypothetical protein
MMLVILLFVRHNIIKNYKSIAIVLLIVVHVSYKKSFLIGCELLFHECIAKHAEKEINQLRFSIQCHFIATFISKDHLQIHRFSM